jgi:hypothetical protein
MKLFVIIARVHLNLLAYGPLSLISHQLIGGTLG